MDFKFEGTGNAESKQQQQRRPVRRKRRRKPFNPNVASSFTSSTSSRLDNFQDTEIRIEPVDVPGFQKRIRLEILNEANARTKKSNAILGRATTTVHLRRTSTVRFRVPCTSLPMLLRQRETYGFCRGSHNSPQVLHRIEWQSRMLQRQGHSAESGGRNRNYSAPGARQIDNTMLKRHGRWRPFCHRILRFRELGTSVNDAVLGLDASASYIVVLGAHGENKWALRLLALPSKSEIIYRRRSIGSGGMEFGNIHGDSTAAPLSMTIPLEDRRVAVHDDSNNDDEVSQFWEEAQIPVRIWLCTDGRVGAALFRSGGIEVR
jgi:hypothetical protein